MSLKRYVTVLDMTTGVPVRHLGSDSVCPVDGRLTDRNALLRSQEWAKQYAERKHIKPYILVLFSASSLSATWYFRRHLSVSADATISAMEHALN